MPTNPKDPSTPTAPKTPKDVGELAAHGISPEQLIASADPDMVVIHTTAQERLRLAGEHLDALRRLAVQILADPDRLSQETALRRVLLGTSGTWTAHAYLRLKDEVSLQLAEVHHVRGLGGVVDEVTSRLAQRARAQERHLLDQAMQGALDASTLQPLGPAFDGCAGLDPRLRLPAGYDCDTHGIWRRTQGRFGVERHNVLMTPAAILSMPMDIETHQDHAALTWRRTHAGGAVSWTRRQVPLRTICDGVRLLDLASDGLLVDGIVARQAARFLALFAETNSSVLERPWSARRCGWLGSPAQDKPLAFLLGGVVKPPPGVKPPRGGWPSQDTPPGVEPLRDSIIPRGSPRSWCRLFVDVARRFPLAALPVYAACASPLLHILERPPFVLHLYGDTSSGKSSALRLGASAVGHPGEDAGLVAGWDVSIAGLENRAAYLHHLPVFLDETKRHKRTDEVARMVYGFTSSTGRLRATLDGGQRPQQTWRNVLVSTGESPLAATTEDPGLRARVLDVGGAPLGDAETEARRTALAIDSCIPAHHGHLLPSILTAIQSQPPSHWLKRHAEVTATLTSSSSAVEGRLLSNVAIVAIAAELVHHFVETTVQEDLETHRSIDLLLDVSKASKDDDPVRRAIALAYNFAAARPSHFWGRHSTDLTGDPCQPPQGWLGVWDKSPSWPTLWIIEDVLAKTLASSGFKIQDLKLAWARRNLLDHDQGRRTGKPYMAGSRPRCIGFKRAAIAACLDIPETALSSSGQL